MKIRKYHRYSPSGQRIPSVRKTLVGLATKVFCSHYFLFATLTFVTVALIALTGGL